MSGIRAIGWLLVIAGSLLAAIGIAIFVVDSVAVALLLLVGAGSLPDPSSLVLVVVGACAVLPGYRLARVGR